MRRHEAPAWPTSRAHEPALKWRRGKDSNLSGSREHVVAGRTMKLTATVRDGRQGLVRLDEQVDLDAEIATFTATVEKWSSYNHRIGREKEYQLLLEVDL